MDPIRRALLASAAAAAGACASAPRFEAALLEPDVVPTRPAAPTPGRPGDFDFLAGEWRIRHRMRKSLDAPWETFEGEATCWTLLGGVGSVEELRVPARDFLGMGLRLLDRKSLAWSDHWVNAKGGAIAAAGLTGSFENGVGIFLAEDEEDGRRVIAGGLWDRITRDSCRWRQVASRDGGRTWEHTWLMDWRRA